MMYNVDDETRETIQDRALATMLKIKAVDSVGIPLLEVNKHYFLFQSASIYAKDKRLRIWCKSAIKKVDHTLLHKWISEEFEQ